MGEPLRFPEPQLKERGMVLTGKALWWTGAGVVASTVAGLFAFSVAAGIRLGSLIVTWIDEVVRWLAG